MKYRILILSNCKGSGLKDDTILKESFEADGHFVAMETVFYDENQDESFDVIIRRNTWVSSEAETDDLYLQNQRLVARLQEKGIKTVNLLGLDGQGKGYLCDLFRDGKQVIPTISSLGDLHLLPDSSTYVVKNMKSFGNGLHQKFFPKESLHSTENYEEGDIIQPKMTFSSEIQCYYVAGKAVYTFEYSPSKFPNYPEPNLITLNDEEQALSDYFAKWSGLSHGFQRIDFLRQENGSLILMEIEDRKSVV